MNAVLLFLCGAMATALGVCGYCARRAVAHMDEVRAAAEAELKELHERARAASAETAQARLELAAAHRVLAGMGYELKTTWRDTPEGRQMSVQVAPSPEAVAAALQANLSEPAGKPS